MHVGVITVQAVDENEGGRHSQRGAQADRLLTQGPLAQLAELRTSIGALRGKPRG